MNRSAQWRRQVDQVLDRLVEADALAALGRLPGARACWVLALAGLHGIAPAVRHRAYDVYLTAVQVALALGDRDMAASLLAQADLAMRGRMASPALVERAARLRASSQGRVA